MSERELLVCWQLLACLIWLLRRPVLHVDSWLADHFCEMTAALASDAVVHVRTQLLGLVDHYQCQMVRQCALL